MPKFVIKANAQSDDGSIFIEFDAEPWFKQALDKDIFALARNGWGGCYPADQVVTDSSSWVPKLADMLRFLELNNALKHDRRQELGFECLVDTDDAWNWLRENRMSLYNQMVDLVEKGRMV